MPMMHVRPGLPVTSIVAKAMDGNIILHFEHTTGATALVVNEEFCKALVKQIQEVTGGIVVADNVPSTLLIT